MQPTASEPSAVSLTSTYRHSSHFTLRHFAVSFGIAASTACIVVGSFLYLQRKQSRIEAQERTRDDLFRAVEEGQNDLVERYIKAWINGGFSPVRTGRTPLHAAAFKGRLNAAKLLLTNGVCTVDAVFSAPDNVPGNISALHLAAENGHPALVNLLLDYGADINMQMFSGQTALICGAANNSLSVVEALLNHNANVNIGMADGTRPIHVAIIAGNLQMVRALLQVPGIDLSCTRNSDPEHTKLSVLHFAAELNRDDIVEELLRHKEKLDLNAQTGAGYTPLHCAARVNAAKIASMLLDVGAALDPVDASLTTPLHIAVAEHALEVVKLLLERGADVHAARRLGTLAGVTPLHLAAETGFVEALELLIKKGAEIDAMYDTGQTPLMSACWKGHTDCVKMLLEKGADPNKKMRTGATCLLTACSFQFVEIARVLLQNGANPTVSFPSDGCTGLHLCIGSDKEASLALCQMLLNATKETDPSFVNAVTKNGATALLGAAIEGDVELIRLLLQNNAKVELANEDNETPLIQACLNGHVEAARFLKLVGANPMHIAATKSGVLHMAVLSRSLPMVKEVLSWTNRPDIDFVNEDGDTALHYAYGSRTLNIVRELEKAGASTTIKNARGERPSEMSERV